MQGYQKPDASLKKLLSKVGSEYELEYVPVRAEAYATLLNCFPNVEEKVRRDGGKPHYGWLIHKTKLLYEAERHAVWETKDEELIDITPHEPSVAKIQFIPDNNWVYAGKSVDNIRVNRTKNPLVDDFILLAEVVAQARAYGSQDDGHIIMPTPAVDVAAFYEKMKQDLLHFIRLGGQPHFPCFCGLPGTYRSCHGSQLRENTAIVLQKLRRVLSNPSE